MLKKYLLVIVLGITIVVISFFLGQRYYATKNHYLIRELQLNAVQKQKYVALTDDLRSKHENLCAVLCAQREDLYDLLVTAPIDKSRINSKIEEITQSQAKIEKETVNYICSVQEILTPQQRTKYLSALNDKLCQFNAESLGSMHHKKKTR